jgi:iron(III) transport system substrate-binding protein
LKLIEWLTGEHAQQLYADMNYEYPLRADVKVNATIASYGALNADKIPLVDVANKKKAAANLVDKIGFDN